MIPTAPDISVCIVTRAGGRQLEQCVASLEAQVHPPPFEVLVCGDACARVPEVGQATRTSVAFVQGVDSAWVSPADKRNVLIERARGELLLFLDDDIVADPRLLINLATVASSHPQTVVFGGPNLTPPGSASLQFVQGAVLGSIVATGPARRRWGRHPPGVADERWFTLCNLAVRRTAMLPFVHGLDAGEETALLGELHLQGHAMRYDPGLVVAHERRPTVGGFARQIYKFGRGRGRIAWQGWANVRPLHLLPSALLAYLLMLPMLAPVTHAAMVPLGAYGLAVAAQAAKIAVSFDARRVQYGLAAGTMIVMLHVCYGAGVLVGLCQPRQPSVAFNASWGDATGRPAS